MKKILLTLLALAVLTIATLAAEETVDYEGTTYVYGGQATETTDDNENGYLDGLILRGVTEATYYTAGDGFLYFTPATEEAPALMIMDNATMVADYCIQAVTDLDVMLVGDNFLHATSPDYFCINVVETYDSDMELLEGEYWNFGTLTIDGDGSLDSICNGYIGFNVGQFALHGGNVSVTTGEGCVMAIMTNGHYESKELPGFWMDGGKLDIDMSAYTEWGIAVCSGDVVISGGALTIRGGTSDSQGMTVEGLTKDVDVSITGGTTVIESNGPISFLTAKFSAEVTASAVVDFTDDPDGLFALNGMFQFFDSLTVDGNAGTTEIAIFDAVTMDNTPQLTTKGLSDYVYCINEFSSYDPETVQLLSFTATMEGQPAITDDIRLGLVYPYTLENNPDVSFSFTRAQIVALLWDSMGCPETAMNNPFTDVSPEDSYYEAILWAVEQGITIGDTATTFDPDALCTKGQLLTFLFRNAGKPAVDVENIFADVDEDSYLYDSVLWGIANTMMDIDTAYFNADYTVLSDGAIAYLTCMG
ncbi:MAG: S-layer homology domain-containing protein [Eubacteriales bacterium]